MKSSTYLSNIHLLTRIHNIILLVGLNRCTGSLQYGLRIESVIYMNVCVRLSLSYVVVFVDVIFVIVAVAISSLTAADIILFYDHDIRQQIQYNNNNYSWYRKNVHVCHFISFRKI